MPSKETNAATIPLEQFVTATLKNILKGVAASQAEARDLGAHVNPVGTNFNQATVAQRTFTLDGNLAQLVEFEVAVTAAENTSGKGKAGVQIGVLGLGVSAQLDTTLTAVNRVKFTVPVLLPGSRVSDPAHSTIDLSDVNSGVASRSVR